MTYDVVIKNGTVVDGTGRPRFHADVAVRDGKIVEIGDVTGSSKNSIDASDLVVAPGFIDPHTHYDAQMFWDPWITPSGWHGVTTVVIGNCGVGLAPCRPEAREMVMRDLENVEAIDFDVLNKGVPWEWESFPEFMDAAEARGTALNVAFLAALTPFRHYVMGEDSISRAATADETSKIKSLLREAVAAGAIGWSTSYLPNHVGYQGRPLACRNADAGELKAYAAALREVGKGTIQIALTKKTSILDAEEAALLDVLLSDSGRPVTLATLLARHDLPNAHREMLAALEKFIPRGASPQISSVPRRRDIFLTSPFPFISFETWKPAFNRTPEEQAALYRDPAFRAAFRNELKEPRNFRGAWDKVIVNEVVSPALKQFEGLSVAEVAQARGVDGIDAILDLALEDDLKTEFNFEYQNIDVDAVAELLRNPHALIGLGDGGAHVSQMCEASYCTDLLGKWVRERNVLSLEEAVLKLTSQPAEVFGIRDRGRLEPGLAADVVVFDPAEVRAADRTERRYDLPGQGKRLVRRGDGVHQTLVNGELAYADGAMLPAKNGRVLRST